MIAINTATKKYNYCESEDGDLFTGIASLLKSHKYGKIAIFTDENVARLYIDALKSALDGFTVISYVIKAGEQSKNLTSVAGFCEFLAENDFDRTDLVLALGGGVVGDTAAFAASIFKRGIAFAQVPTTLLAQIDSSIGGKTGVNLIHGKNLVGTFAQPEFVFAEAKTLDTLPVIEWQNGFGEAIKYAAIYDAKLLDLFTNFNENIREIVGRCVKIKAYIVEQDTFDNGIRQILNFGHTLGHAIEKALNYQIPHGIAVCLGMLKITRLTEQKGWTDKGTLDILQNAAKTLGLPTKLEFSDEKLIEFIRNDKKIRNGKLTLVYLEKFGIARLKEISVGELLS